MKGMGAKKRLGIMQGRGSNDTCAVCMEDANNVTECTGCGDFICKECRMDHNCTQPDTPPNKPPKK